MRVTSLTVDLAVISTRGKFYAMAWDAETMNLILDADYLTREDAEQALANFVLETLRVR